MATITLKNIPETLHKALKKRAASHRRSLNGEAIVCLEGILLGRHLDVSSFLDRVRRLRAATPGQIDDDFIRKARESGRP